MTALPTESPKLNLDSAETASHLDSVELSATGRVAFFDFDHTLISQESLTLFLRRLAGQGPFLWACFVSLFLATAHKLTGGAEADFKTSFKDGLLKRCLKDKTEEQALDAADSMLEVMRWKKDIVGDLMDHIAKGDKVIIATGALDLYIHRLLHDIPHHGVLCTETERKEDGETLTGLMAGSGNCVRGTKAMRVQKYLEQHGPFKETFGYGNAPSDLPMMQHCDHNKVI